MRRRWSPAATTVFPLALAILLAGCGEDRQPAIAEAVAGELDPLNGLPTVVVNVFWCDHRNEACLPGTGHPAASPLDATALAGAFAGARGIPLADREGFVAPACPWGSDGADEEHPAGLYAQFLRPPVVTADSAWVELATGCSEGRAAFEQIHRFILRRQGGHWRVVRRDLTSIT